METSGPNKCTCGNPLNFIVETNRCRRSSACGEPIVSTQFFSCPKCRELLYCHRINSGNFLCGDEIGFSELRKYTGYLTEDELKKNMGNNFGDFCPAGYQEEKLLKEWGRFFEVTENKKTLKAILFEKEGKKRIDVVCTDGINYQLARYTNGYEKKLSVILNGIEMPLDNEYTLPLPGYIEIYNQLGPKLRQQLPSGWDVALGNWLKGKN